MWGDRSGSRNSKEANVSGVRLERRVVLAAWPRWMWREEKEGVEGPEDFYFSSWISRVAI